MAGRAGPERPGRAGPGRRERGGGDGAGRPADLDDGGQEAQRRARSLGRSRGRPPRQRGDALPAAAGHRHHRPVHGRGRGGLPARCLHRRVRARHPARGRRAVAIAEHRGVRPRSGRRRTRGGPVRRGRCPEHGRVGLVVPQTAGGRGDGLAARRHREPAGPGPGQNGGGRDRHRPPGAPEHRGQPQEVGGGHSK